MEKNYGIKDSAKEKSVDSYLDRFAVGARGAGWHRGRYTRRRCNREGGENCARMAVWLKQENMRDLDSLAAEIGGKLYEVYA